jgi:hypothetical protein
MRVRFLTRVPGLTSVRRALGRELRSGLVSSLAARLLDRAAYVGMSLATRGWPPQTVLLGLLPGAWVAQSISVVARLGIADLLDQRPRTCDELAAQCGAHGPSLYRVMRALASLGLFTEDRRGRFHLTRIGRCLRTDAPDSMRAVAIYAGSDRHWRAWGDLQHSVRTGQSAFEHQTGRPAYDFYQSDPDAAALFNATMTVYATPFASAVASADLGDARTVVDVGGGHGTVLAAVLRAHPTLRGVLFDLPEVIRGAPSGLAAAGIAARVDLVGGSFFEAVPSGGDVYLLTSILHNWDDERAIAILRACRRAMAGSGRLLVAEYLVRPGNAPSIAKLMDLEMLVHFSGGRERTAAEYRALFEAAGFRLERVQTTLYSVSILEGVCA